MTDLIAVCRREIAERRLALLLAAVVGLIPLFLPLLPALDRHSPAEVRGGAAVLFGMLTALGAAVALGGSIWAGDFASGRIAFYLARPIRSWAIWGGKLLALLALLTVMVGLVSLPGVLAGERLEPALDALVPTWWLEFDLPWLIGGVLALAFASHLARTLSSRRSALVLLDLSALLLASAALMTAARRLLDAPAIGDLQRGAGGLLILLSLTALAAVAVETSIGRMASARGRRATSLALWVGLLLAGCAGWLFSRWTLAVELEDLEWAEVASASPDGRWLYIGGPARHRVDYAQGFLYDLETRRAKALGGILRGMKDRGSFDDLVFSRDGRRAVWKHFSYPATTAWSLDLAGESLPVELGETSYQTSYALSPSGRLLARWRGRSVEVVDLSSQAHRLVAVERLPQRVSRSWLHFLSEDRLRVVSAYLDDVATSAVWDLDLTSRKLAQICLLPDHWSASLSPDADRLVARVASGSERVLVALPDCERLATITEAKLDWPPDLSFLADGRIARVVGQETSRVLRIHDRDGAVQAELDLGSARLPWLGGMPAANQLVVSLGDEAKVRTAQLLDLTTGERRGLGPGLLPVAQPSTAIGSPATRVFATAEGLVQLDLATGERTLLTSVPSFHD